MNLIVVWALILGCGSCYNIIDKLPEKYTPDWSSLDKRPTPTWYDEAKIGIFIHWGVYSVPSISSEWFWIDWKGNPSPNKKEQEKIEKFMKKNYKPGFTYQDFASDFTAEFFDPDQWTALFNKSGAKYVVLTSKHHDGFALWPSKYSFSWNSVDVGPHRDIVGELAAAVKNAGLHFGLYHSLYEWFHPLYLSDKANNYSTRQFVDNKIMAEMKELINSYKPEVFWSDGEWEASSLYWRSKEFLTWLFNESPVSNSVAVNDRWGSDTLCKHGGYYTCQDRYNPGILQHHKWENAMTIDSTTWGYNRLSDVGDYKTTKELIDTLAETVSCGGNLLMNVGPAKDGKIHPIFQDRLLGIGEWLELNGEAIYRSKPWSKCQNDSTASGIWYTTSGEQDTLYAIMLIWPSSNILYLSCPTLSKDSVTTMLGIPKALQVTVTDEKMIKIALPDKAQVASDLAWSLKITHIPLS